MKKSKKLGVKITPKTESGESSNSNNSDENNVSEGSDGSIEIIDKELQELHVENDNKVDLTNITKKDKSEDLKEVCKLLDKLTVETLSLIEQNMQLKLKIETTMTEGEAHLAKSRYIMGHTNVSSLQLPTENSFDIDPAVTITELSGDESYFGEPCLSIDIENFNKNPKPNEKNIQDPIHWFGVLVPRNLHMAQSSFKNCLDDVVECANSQIRLNKMCEKIKKLLEIKKVLEVEVEE